MWTMQRGDNVGYVVKGDMGHIWRISSAFPEPALNTQLEEGILSVEWGPGTEWVR